MRRVTAIGGTFFYAEDPGDKVELWQRPEGQ